jgi:hypothetical protein
MLGMLVPNIGSLELQMAKFKPIVRFISKLNLNANEFGCWFYTGGRLSNGYGIFDEEGKSRLAHRWIYGEGVTRIPRGMRVLHRCDQRACVNPFHLFLGSAKDNSVDMVSKGRNRVKKRTPRPISNQELRDIRMSNKRGESCYSIAKRLGRDQCHIARIVSGRLHGKRRTSL